MSHVHLVIGPVGAGKSTLAAQLSRQQGAVRFTLDAWMARLYGADPRPPDGVPAWYRERATRCLGQIWEVARTVLDASVPVVLEIGLLQRHERAAFYARLDREARPLTVWVVDAPRDVRRARVERRNEERGETFSMFVPLEVFELASDLWEPPDALEREERALRFP
jgi:predicted kinase